MLFLNNFIDIWRKLLILPFYLTCYCKGNNLIIIKFDFLCVCKNDAEIFLSVYRDLPAVEWNQSFWKIGVASQHAVQL